jgi:hypothetical protein
MAIVFQLRILPQWELAIKSTCAKLSTNPKNVA